MEQSQYLDLIKKYFSGLAREVVQEIINGLTNPNNRTYRHLTMLRKEFSMDMTWRALNIMGRVVAADVVAMDSTIPLKNRDSIKAESGDIPKTGTKRAIREKQLTELDILARMPNMQEQQIVQFFRDTRRVIESMYELREYMFLKGLSTGITEVPDANNVGASVRADFGYQNANKFGASVVWSTTATATPFSDLKRVRAKATRDGNRITRFMMDDTTFNYLVQSAEAKQLYATFSGYYGTALSDFAIPTLEQVNRASQGNFGFTFEIVERTVLFERDGIDTVLTPWEPGAVVGITDNNVGTLTWGTLAEMTRPVAGVAYETVDDSILISKYRKNEPLAEFTKAESLALPVITDVYSKYLLDTTVVQA